MKKLHLIILLSVLTFGAADSAMAQSNDDFDNWIYEGDKSITEYQIPDGVRVIGDEAFMKCENLESITIPESVTSIGASAFELCTSLKSVFIPKNVKEIKGCAFSSCYSLRCFEVDKENNYFTAIDGVIFSYDKTKLVVCPNRKEYAIPAGTKIIGYYSLQGCRDLISVTIPNSVETIEEGAFSICNGLTTIEIPPSVKEIGSAAFWKSENLYKITIPEGITEIERSLFKQCKGLTTVIIPKSVKEIGQYAFLECENLKKITIPNGVEKIDKYAFSECENLISITIPKSVGTIGEAAFWKCKNLTSVTLSKGLKVINTGAFGHCINLQKIIIPKSVDTIGAIAFIECDKLRTVTIHAKNIIKGAFTKCQNLKSVNIAEGCEKIGENAFSICPNLETITIPGTVKEIGYYAFGEDTSLNKVVLRNGIDKIGLNAFYDCKSLKSITLPGSINEVGDNVFSNPLTISSDMSTLSQLAKFKCMADAYKCAEQYDSMHNCITKIIELLHTSQNKNVYCMPFYKDATNYYSRVDDYDKVLNYSQECLSTDFGTISPDMEQKYQSLKYYFMLRVAYAYLSLKDYEKAKATIEQFEIDYPNPNGYEHGSTDALISYLNNDYHLGTYYYYLLLKMYYELNDIDNMKKYVDIFIFKSILEKGSLYMANVACYYLKIREFCLGDLTSMLQALESDLIKSFQKISINNSGCNEMYPSFADCHYHKGDLDSAFKYYSKAIEYDLKYLKTMNVNQRPKYWEHCRSSFENVIKLSTKLLDNKDAACKAYNALLVSKSDLMNYKENNWQQVKNSLNENDVAIEFFYDGDSSLCALVVKKNFDSPELVTLGKSGADIWQPLERFFSQGGDVYFSPAGELSNVDVKNESEDVPVQLSEKFKIHRVQSTCDIVNER